MNSTHCRLITALVALCCSCTPVQMVGSRYVKAQEVTATEGGTLTISAADSTELAGAKLIIPPGALAATTEITVELGGGAIVKGGDTVAGQYVIFGPSGTTFSTPAEMTLPYTLPAGHTVSELFVQVEEEDGTRFVVDRSLVTVDEQNHLLRFKVHGFTGFQPGMNPPCQANSDCAQGQVCVNGICKAPGCSSAMNQQCQCQSNSECAQGQVCSNGLCQSCTTNSCTGACSNINQCPMGQACLNGQCTVCTNGSCSSSCASNTQCQNGAVCLMGVCVQPACGPNAPCPMGQTCSASGACVPTQNGCGMNTACAAGQVCVNGQCTATMNQCGPNVPCPMGQTCTASGTCSSCANGQCPQCDAQHPCLQGEVCVNGSCSACMNGACGSCQTNTDCPSGQACVSGQCRITMTQCGPNAPCPMGQTCDSQGQCVTANACNNGMGCPTGQQCVNGVCSGGCPMGTVLCGNSCVNLTNDPSNCNACGTVCQQGQICQLGNCTPASTCNNGMGCSPNQQCVMGQCIGGGGDGGSNQCQTSQQCAMGQSCVNGQCQVSSGGDGGTSTCNNGMGCSPNQQCLNGQCVGGGGDAGNGGNDGGTGGNDGGTGGNDGGTVVHCGDAGTVCTNGTICFGGGCQTVSCGMGQTCPMPYACVQNFCR